MDQRQPARTARTSIAVHLVSVDASPPGLPQGVTSAVSVTYAFFGGPIEYYDGAQVFIVGAKKVSDITSAIGSAVEKRATKLSGQAESCRCRTSSSNRSMGNSATPAVAHISIILGRFANGEGLIGGERRI
jgi:hypothetical protein